MQRSRFSSAKKRTYLIRESSTSPSLPGTPSEEILSTSAILLDSPTTEEKIKHTPRKFTFKDSDILRAGTFQKPTLASYVSRNKALCTQKNFVLPDHIQKKLLQNKNTQTSANTLMTQQESPPKYISTPRQPTYTIRLTTLQKFLHDIKGNFNFFKSSQTQPLLSENEYQSPSLIFGSSNESK